MKTALLAVLTASAALVASAGPPDPSYALEWSDEFDGTSLDRSKWMYRQLGPRRDAVNTEDAVTLDGEGNLVLTTRREGDEIRTAMIATQGIYETRFGYFECRVRFQTQIGHWSAFWLQSPTMQKVGDPRRNGTEIDIYEFLANHPNTLHINLHWDGYAKDHKSKGSKVKTDDLRGAWHTVGLEWTPEEYVFFLDGKEVWRTSEAVSHVDEYIILSLEVGKWAGDVAAATLPDSVLFDYVRVYKKKPDPR